MSDLYDEIKACWHSIFWKLIFFISINELDIKNRAETLLLRKGLFPSQTIFSNLIIDSLAAISPDKFSVSLIKLFYKNLAGLKYYII